MVSSDHNVGGKVMKIKLYNKQGGIITYVDGVINPQQEFDHCYRDMYGAVSWEEVVPQEPTKAELVNHHNTLINAQIVELEQKQLRATRELLLSYDGAKERLKAIDDEIVELRGELQ